MDFLRFVAVTAVIARHVYDRTPQLDSFLSPFAAIGWMGVSLFFVISGYIVGGPLAERIRAGSFSYERFIVDRALRILPAAVAVLALCHYLRPFDDLNIGSYVQTLFFGNYWQPYVEFAYSGQFWSLAVEQHFYLLAPLVIASLNVRLPALAVLLAVFELAKLQWGHYTKSHWQVDYFAVGILLYLGRDMRFRLGGWPVAIATFALAAAIAPHTDRSGMLLALAVSVLVFIAAKQGPQATISGAAFRLLGVLSYSLYLVHLLVVENAEAQLRWIAVRFDDPAGRYVASLVLVFAGSVLCATVLLFVIERPFLALRGWLRSR